jgi:hypothetical protein
MRKIAIFAGLVLLCSPALGQQQTPTATGDSTASPAVTASPPSTVGAAPSVGGSLHPGTTVGLDKVGDDGVSTKTVKAVPCGTAARETDGSTTCVGIPEPGASRSRR